MIKKEHGFTYPLTLMIIFLFILFFSARVDQLLTERKLAHEKTVIFQQEYYFLLSVKRLEKLYQTGVSIPSKAVMNYKSGSVEYQTESPIGSVQKISLTLLLSTGETIYAIGYFDINLKQAVKWVEIK